MIISFKSWLLEVGDTPWDAAPKQKIPITALPTYRLKRKGEENIPPAMKKKMKVKKKTD